MKTYSRYNKSKGQYDRERQKHRGRDDGSVEEDDRFVWCEEIREEKPEIDETRERLEETDVRVVDPENPLIGTRTFGWRRVDMTQEERDAYAAEEAEREDREAKRRRGAATVTWLRARAEEAAGTTVTAANAVPVLQKVVDSLAVFYAGMADMMEGQWMDREDGGDN